MNDNIQCDTSMTTQCDNHLELFLRRAMEYQLKYGGWSYKAFKRFYSHGYFRNVVSKLIKLGRIARIEPRSCPATYRIKGVDMPGKHDFVITDRMGVRQELIDKLFQIQDCKEPAIHDIRLVGHATGLHNASIRKGSMNDVSKDITLINWDLDPWRNASVVVHNTDTFSVIFRCSSRPIIANALHVTEWFITLGKLAEKISQISGIEIPHPSLWQVRALHFNQDMYSGIDLPEGIVICTRDIHDNLVRIYTKKLPQEPKTMVRCEIIQDAKDSKPVFQKASELLNIEVVSNE